MVQTAIRSGSESATGTDTFIKAFRLMLLARTLDDKFASLYRGGKIFGGVFLGRGRVALCVSVGGSLGKGEVFAPVIGEGAGRLALGEAVLAAVGTDLGSPRGPMRSRV